MDSPDRVAGLGTPQELLRRLVPGDGLVVLSGEWAGGGLVVAQHPIATVDSWPALRGALAEPAAGSLAGGWFGWLGYPQTGTPPLWFGRYPNVLRYDRTLDAWFDEAATGLVPADELAARRWQLRNPAGTRGDYRLGTLTPDVTAADYAAAVERTIRRIRAGDIYQANVCLQLSADFAGDPVTLFADLVRVLEPAYAALVCGPDATLVSLSPELFLRRRGRDVLSAPIKGTRPQTTGMAGDPQAVRLRRSVKDRAENVMIVDLVRNDLSRVADGVTVPQLLAVEPHCGVWQLVSRVAGRLRTGVDDAAVLDATFPPGSVTGAPKLAARAVIDEVEASTRGVYTGAVGYLGGDSELNVAIRTLELRGGRAVLGAGAGITVGSVPGAEWQECLDKAVPLAGAAGTTIAVDPPPDRSAGGVFDTMLVRDGRVIAAAEHVARLAASARELWDLELPGLAELVGTEAAGLGATARLRVDADRTGRLTVRSAAAQPPRPLRGQPGLVLGVEPLQGGLGRHKWSDRVLVDTLEAARGGQVLLVDTDGTCLETTRGNILAVQGNQLVVPPLDERILPGVTRLLLLDLADDFGVPVRLRELRIAELAELDGLLVTGSVGGAQWVRSAADATWPAPTPLMGKLADALLATW